MSLRLHHSFQENVFKGCRSFPGETYWHSLGHPTQIALENIAQADPATRLMLREYRRELLSCLDALAVNVSDYVVRVQTGNFSGTLRINFSDLDSSEALFHRLGKQTLYFFPDRVLVFKGSEVGAVNYDSISVSLGQTQFVEEDEVPSDAKIVGSTWRYVNKNGTPDRRFNNNRQIPIVLYSQISISSASGLNIAMESSDLSKAAAFKMGLSHYVNTY